jgi:hypothetical protein
MISLSQRIIFDIIEREGADSDALKAARFCTRKILITAAQEVKLEDDGQNLPNILPDMSLVDVNPDLAQVDSNTIKGGFRRQAVSFIEVEVNSGEDPKPSNVPVKKIAAQAADYAGLVFASRPLQIFVIGFVIFGRYFRATLYTHSNVYYSERYDILADTGLEMLIRVVRRVTWQLTDRDMGLDPTVRLAEGHTFYGPSYPSFVVGMTGGAIPHHHPPSNESTTKGHPLWSSLSWLGRSSSVWKCTDGSVLKVAWRNEKRMSESEIYAHASPGSGVARLVNGGDVCMLNVGGNFIKLDTNFIISRLSEGTKIKRTDFNVVLHRVYIQPTGKPLCDYSAIEELLRGLLAALKGLFCTSALLPQDLTFLCQVTVTFMKGESYIVT